MQAMKSLREQLGAFALHSHLETGNLWTYDRDRRVSRWCLASSVTWHEYAQTGVFRPVKRRGTTFRSHWEEWVSIPQFEPPSAPMDYPGLENFGLSSVAELPPDIKVDALECPAAQSGGRQQGVKTLQSFLESRGQHYSSKMSSPLSAENSCSRLSPYLTYGCLSLREVAQEISSAQLRTKDAIWRKSLGACRKRLWWHCYWMQTLENNPAVETTSLSAPMALLHRPFHLERFLAWKNGRTGWPMVDACMRYLHHHGWINFRMRAMLVTSATCTLSLPWQPVAEWLGQMFVDFEPGIHYPQIQMHSATVSGTVLRIYNPVVQAQTLDPHGIFVRQWVPELRGVSDSWIFRPWDMPASLRLRFGLIEKSDYPSPLVDFETANRAARQHITNLRQAHCLEPAPGFNERRQRSEQKKISKEIIQPLQGQLF